MEMIDKSKIIEGLECCSTKNRCEECPYYAGWNEDCVGALSKDVLKLLRKQEPKLITAKVRKVLWDETDDGPVYNMDTFYHCPKCDHVLSRTNENKDVHFCSKCGQAVLWDDK